MIKNIILDVGMVLVDFCWEQLLHNLGITGVLFEAVANATVRTPEWNEYDRSAEPDPVLLERLIENAPSCQEQIQLFWNNMEGMIVQYPYTKNWIQSMKAAGYQVYILSNYARRTYELTKNTGLDFLPLMDGVVFSFQTGYIKPEPEIYQYIMEKYRLDPAECIFLDDNPDNLIVPNQIGWHTIQFRGLEQAQEELEAAGVYIKRGV